MQRYHLELPNLCWRPIKNFLYDDLVDRHSRSKDFWANPEEFLNQSSQIRSQAPSKKLLKELKPLDKKIKLLKPIEQNIQATYSRDADSVAIREICTKNGRQADLTKLEDLSEARFRRDRLLSEFAKRCTHPRVPAIKIPERTFCHNAPFDASRTWAVVIGINYEGDCHLTSAANDARFFFDHLKDRGVGDDHICLLVDDEERDQLPTRDGILHALHDLRDNDNIHHGDTIIIWYSGRGTSYHGNRFWKGARGRIKALVPTDHRRQPDISDRELNLFLTDLANSKGNNITFILDCCFAAGTFRSGMATCATSRVRSLEPVDHNDLRRMLEAAESYTRKSWQPGRALCHPSDWNADQSSHVAIYASAENERAYEDDTGGMLANALFRILVNEDLTSVSYRKLVSIIGSLGTQQNPGVIGYNANCLVFRISQKHSITEPTFGTFQ